MILGACKIRFRINGVRSLKEKRKTLKSLKDRVSRMNVSIAEVDDQDKWQAATLGIALVSNDTAHVNSILDRVFLFLVEYPGVELIDKKTEIIHI
ncbi:MAG TPA: DUF503 domain-containing protein [Methanomassiliicoccaceae archaeon]|nr:DUF503 domain-containing protein [Methanomassiliicoccaceae archaeon]